MLHFLSMWFRPLKTKDRCKWHCSDNKWQCALRIQKQPHHFNLSQSFHFIQLIITTLLGSEFKADLKLLCDDDLWPNDKVDQQSHLEWRWEIQPNFCFLSGWTLNDFSYPYIFPERKVSSRQALALWGKWDKAKNIPSTSTSSLSLPPTVQLFRARLEGLQTVVSDWKYACKCTNTNSEMQDVFNCFYPMWVG